MSAFNTVLTINKMPYLPFMFKSSQYKSVAGDFCSDIKTVLTEKITLFDVIDLYLKKKAVILDEFLPIVDNRKDRRIIGSVRTQNLLSYITIVAKEIEDELKKKENKKYLSKIYNKLTQFWEEDNEQGATAFGRLWVSKILLKYLKVEKKR